MASNIGRVQVATANAGRDGTGTLGTLYTAGSAGSIITRIEAVATVTTVQSMLRFFIYDGTNTYLWYELNVAAVTPSGTVNAWSGNYVPSPALPLPRNYLFKVSTNDAQAINVTCYAQDL